MTAPPPSSLVSVRNLTLRRGPVEILRGIDWTIEPGQHWVILGPNGCGKTSLLNTLSGFTHPSSGEISVFGKVFGTANWTELRKSIGVVNHTVAGWIDPSETALEIVIGGRHAQINYWGPVLAEDRDAARVMLQRHHLLHLQDRSWSQLSQGERQRLHICRALMRPLRLLILDEPCAGLDPVARAAFLEFIESLASRQPAEPALVLVTHHLEEITPSFSHVLLLASGRTLASGPAQRVLRSDLLSEAFYAPLRVRRSPAGYALTIHPPHPEP